jgi:NAD(P)-dependent dehydrogenase (short-subunit alcohol dehydrogenase family)
MRRVLITGGGRGIGRAIALRLAEEGHAIAVTARSTGEIEAVAAEAAAAGAPATAALALDLSDGEAAAELPGRAAEVLGGDPEIFVHAAGIAAIAPVDALDPRDWERCFAVNVDAAFHVTRHLAGPMKDAGWGRIVTVASLRARVGVPTTAAYTASKHALLGLTRVLAAELAAHGATANAIVPGWVDTQMVRDEIEAFAERLGMPVEQAQRRLTREQQIRRLLRPDEVAGLACYLCSESAGGVTGQALHIDGGSYQA